MQSILINVSSNANDQTKRAAEALNTVLNHEGIKAEIDNDTDDPAVVDITVGLKP